MVNHPHDTPVSSQSPLEVRYLANRNEASSALSQQAKYRWSKVFFKPGLAALPSHGAAVEALYLNRCQVKVFETANIGCRHLFSLCIDAFAIKMNATGQAEMVLDDVLNDVLVERVRPKWIFQSIVTGDSGLP